MTQYLISFGAHAMDHIPDEDAPAVVLRGSPVRPFRQAITGTPPLSRDSPIPLPG